VATRGLVVAWGPKKAPKFRFESAKIVDSGNRRWRISRLSGCGEKGVVCLGRLIVRDVRLNVSGDK